MIFQVLGHKKQIRNNWQSSNKSEGLRHSEGVIALGGGSASKFFFAAKKRVFKKSMPIGESSLKAR